jgi:hypothetical protein
LQRWRIHAGQLRITAVTDIGVELAAVARAEKRLEERARARAETRARRERRRELAGGSLELATLALPLATGATVLLVLLVALSGGDLSACPRALAYLLGLAVWVGPPGLAAYRWRRRGRWEAATAAAATLGAQLTLTFGVAFVLLGLGPS